MRMFRVCPWITALAWFLGWGVSVGAQPAEDSIGRTVAAFTLQDYRGHQYSLNDFAEHPILVVAVLGTECPLAKLYAPRLVRLAREYASRGVGFVGINPNSHDSITELAAYARLHGIDFPLLKDLGNRVADQMGAERTPEVFVLDQERRICYRGRIDDQYGVGYIRPEPQRQDLKMALDDLLAGRPVAQACTPVTGCLIGRVAQPQDSAAVTYANQIARILQSRCVECHRDGDIAPFALTEYAEVAGWSEMIAEVVREGRMPPWHASPEFGTFANDRRLSDAERQAIFDWVAAGAPEGDPRELPPPRQFVSGWQLPQKPDLIVPMRQQPYEVPAEGVVQYEYFRVDPQLAEDRWIQAVEVLPGNRAVVHHILVFAEPPGGFDRDFAGGARGFLAGYVPGVRALPYPDGMAKFLPAGSSLVFQLHYTPIGSVQNDLSQIGFVFADAESVRYEVKTMSAFQPFLQIPPEVSDHREATRTRLHESVQLLAMMPHLHVRGKSFQYLSRLPGQSEWTTLLDVPAYDFNWQTAYRLTQPLALPSGTEIRCVAQYDNSEDNLNNPDPKATVRWGEQTWDEMLIGYFDMAVPLDPSQKSDRGSRPIDRIDRVEEFILQLDQDCDDQLQLAELPSGLRRRFAAADLDRDGVLSSAEVRQALRQQRAARR